MAEPESGALFGIFVKPGRYAFSLLGQDPAGRVSVVESFAFIAAATDTLDPQNGPNGAGCVRGVQVDEVLLDGNFTCSCANLGGFFAGDNCELTIAPDASTSEDEDDGKPVVLIASMSTAAFFVLALATIAAFVIRRRQSNDEAQKLKARHDRITEVVRIGERAGRTRLTDALFDAAELGRHADIYPLLSFGADAKTRSSSGELVHTVLMKSLGTSKPGSGQSSAPRQHDEDGASHFYPLRQASSKQKDGQAALSAVFFVHCTIDAQMAALVTRDAIIAQHVVRVLAELASHSWVADDASADAVSHRVLGACKNGNLTEKQTVAISHAILDANPGIVTAINRRQHTAGDIAEQCDDCPDLLRLWSLIVFDRYLVVNATRPAIYKSSHAAVFSCRDLKLEGLESGRQAGDVNVASFDRADANHDGVLSETEFTNAAETPHPADSGGLMVIKVMSSSESWLREIEMRQTMKTNASKLGWTTEQWQSVTIWIESGAALRGDPMVAAHANALHSNIEFCNPDAAQLSRIPFAVELMRNFPCVAACTQAASCKQRQLRCKRLQSVVLAPKRLAVADRCYHICRH